LAPPRCSPLFGSDKGRGVRSTLGFAAALVIVLTVGPDRASAQAPEAVVAAETSWSLAIAGAYFAPALEGWKDQYGAPGRWLPMVAAEYALVPSFRIHGDTGYFSVESAAQGAITGRVSADRQRLSLIPVTLGVEYQLRIRPDQFVIPFVGVGYRRVAYRLAVSGKDDVRGGANGWAARSGVDLLLNTLDPSSASGLSEDYGVAHSYLRLEAQWAKVNASGTAGDIDLGGKTFLAGLKFEF
jgi:hypothetical protein